MARRKVKEPIPEDAQTRHEPLEPAELEIFVRAYRDSFNGAAAAQKAGYENALEVWPEILARSDVQARLRAYRHGRDIPSQSSNAVLAHIFDQVFREEGVAVEKNPITGEVNIHPGTLSAHGRGLVDVTQTIAERGGIRQSVTRIHKRDTHALLLVIAQYLGLREAHPDVGEDPLAKLVREINQRGSAAPIATRSRLEE